MREADAMAVIDKLADHCRHLAVQLAVAEARLEAYERAEVDRLAAEEAVNADR